MGMNPDLFAEPGYEEFVSAGAGFVGVLVLIYLFVIFLSLALSMASYVLHSLGLYTIADRRGIRHSWLAWIPIGNLWLAGSISDQYQYVAKGKIKSRRKAMLGMGIAMVGVYLVWLVLMIFSAISAAGDPTGMSAAGIIPVILGVVALFAVAIVLTVFQYLSYYDLFCSCSKDNAVLFLVLSIVFPITLPVFVFINRKKDEGMPPKKQPQAPEVLPQLTEELTGEAEEPAPTEEGFAQPEEFEEQ